MITFIADLHFGSKNFNKKIFSTQMEFFENQFFPYLLENKIKDVISLGDLAHNRNMIDLFILQELKDRFFKWFEDNDVNLHLIIGNHDLQYRSTLDYNFYKENVNEYSRCIIYKEDTVVKIGKYTLGMIPWIIDTKNWRPPKGCDILCGHFEMKDMPMMKNIFSHEGYQPEIFKDYQLVFTGHYHVRSNKANIHYIGTPYQLNWNDFDEPKGFAVLQDNFQFDYVENKTSPKFIKIHYNSNKENVITVEGLIGQSQSITKEKSLILSKANYVRIYQEKVADQSEFDSWYNSLLTVSKDDFKIEIINTEEVIEDYDAKAFEETLEKESSTIEIILSCIENMTFEESIDKDTLLDMSKLLYQEAMDEALAIGDSN